MQREQGYRTWPGYWVGPETDCPSLSTDTRTLQPGALYIALKGHHADGHEYIPQAVQAGAHAVMVERVQPQCPVPQWVVPNTTDMVHTLITTLRAAHQGPVLGITGSVGKTTTKAFVAAIMEQRYHVLHTRHNWNTEFGLAQLLWQLRCDHDVLVVELAAAKPGDIAFLCERIKPTHGLVTNIQPVHIANYPSFEALVATKTALLSHLLTHEGVAAIPQDDPLLRPWLQRFPAERVIPYAHDHAPVCLRHLSEQQGRVRACLQRGNEQVDLALNIPGLYQADNVLAATALTSCFDIPLPQVASAISQVTAGPRRMQAHTLPQGALLFDDTYNASVSSVQGAIDVLVQHEPPAETLLVLGDLAELRVDEVRSTHEALGQHARDQGVHRLWVVGTHAAAAAHTFGEGGRTFPSQAALIQALQETLHAHSVVLVKGSRISAMDRVVDALLSAHEEVLP